jgi:hypothetical protein
VYGHPLFAALMLGFVVLAFRRDRILALCLGGAGPYVLLGVLFVGSSNTRYGCRSSKRCPPARCEPR